MFGPLNGVRVALVVLAAVTAVIAAAVGQFLVAGVLLIAVAAHGGLWLWMYRHRDGGGSAGAA